MFILEVILFIFSNYRKDRRSKENVAYKETDTSARERGERKREREREREREGERGGGRDGGWAEAGAETELNKKRNIYIYIMSLKQRGRNYRIVLKTILSIKCPATLR